MPDVCVASASDVFQLINSGDAAISRGEVTSAVKAYSDAIALDPKQMLAYTKRAAAYVASHKHSLAVRDFAAALELEPSSVTVLLKKAQLELQLCNFEGAARDFQSVLRFKPEHKAASAGIVSSGNAKASLQKAKVRPCMCPPRRACVSAGVVSYVPIYSLLWCAQRCLKNRRMQQHLVIVQLSANKHSHFVLLAAVSLCFECHTGSRPSAVAIRLLVSTRRHLLNIYNSQL